MTKSKSQVLKEKSEYTKMIDKLSKSKRFRIMVKNLMKAYIAEQEEWHKHEQTGIKK